MQVGKHNLSKDECVIMCRKRFQFEIKINKSLPYIQVMAPGVGTRLNRDF